MWLRALGPSPDLPRPAGLDADRRAGWALWSAALLLVLLVFRWGVDFDGLFDLGGAPPRSLTGKTAWLASGVLSYWLAPLAIVLGVFRESPARYGLRVYISRRTALLYAGLVAVVVVPMVWYAARAPAFLAKYPMVDDLNGDPARIALWESLRAARMVGVEFFFRGFLLFSLEERFGKHAVAVSALPYGLLHFAKPFPEALGALVAAAALGWLALHTRSILGGALLHISAATSMDLLALAKKGLL